MFRTCSVLAAALILGAAAQAQVTWTLVADHPNQAGLTRSLRGIALSQVDLALYGSFIQGSSTAGVRRYTLAGLPPVGTAMEFFNVTTQPFPSSADHQPEHVATDDRGWVYVASVKDSTSQDNARIYICDSTFSTSKMFVLADIESPGSVTSETIGGIDVRKEGSDYKVYVTRFRSTPAPYVERYVVGGATIATATLTLDPTFNGTGRFAIPGGGKLRGIDVDETGAIFVVSRENHTLWRLPPSLIGLLAVGIDRAMDCATHDGRVYVTTYDGINSKVVELDAATLALTGRTFTATGTFPRGATEGYAGIDIDANGRMYVADQIYASNSDRILVSSALCRPNLYETIGTGCVGTSGFVPNIEAAVGSVPQIGTFFDVNITGMVPTGGPFWFVVGFNDEIALGFVPLPIDLVVIGMPGCIFYVSPDAVLPFGHASGSETFSNFTPNNPAIAGGTFFHQVFALDVGANALGMTVSNAKRGCIIP